MNTLKFFSMFFLGLISITALSQNNNDREMKTMFGNTNSIGGYGALTARYSEIGSAPGATIGFRGCLVAGHSIAIGFAGNGIISDFKYDAKLGKDAILAGGYGGLHLEPILNPYSPIHLAIPMTIGAGGISYSTTNRDFTWTDNTNDPHNIDSKAFFFFEPGIELEMNVLKFVRFAIGGYYRFTSDVSLHYADNTPIQKSDFLRGFSAGLTLKFGKF